MTTILLCEICREPIARFNPDDLRMPLRLDIFHSLYPEREVPDPFLRQEPTMWERSFCPRCRRRPFLNFWPRDDGTVIVSSGEAVPDGGQWYVMILGASGMPEKMVISPAEQPTIPPERPTEDTPPQRTEEVEPEEGQEPDTGGEEQQQPAPTGNYKSPPVSCPYCGKQFRSQGRLEKFHQDCPKRPPQEGFKL